MNNEFDPILKKKMHRRRAERRRQQAKEADKERVKIYLSKRGLTDVSQDPTLSTTTACKPCP